MQVFKSPLVLFILPMIGLLEVVILRGLLG